MNLQLIPENKYQYQLDDKWTDFEVSQLPIKVKLLGHSIGLLKEKSYTLNMVLLLKLIMVHMQLDTLGMV